MRLLVLLSGEHPTLPVSELRCVGRILEGRPQVAVVESSSVEGSGRLAMAHSVMEFLGECQAEKDALAGLLKDLAISATKPYAARVSRIAGTEMKEAAPVLEKLMGTFISGTVDLEKPEEEYRTICSGDRCYVGKVLFNPDRGAYDLRNPGKRAFFHPGVMMPRIARTLVNISLVRQGEWLLDPFCETGGILIEAGLIGAYAAGVDMDPVMVRGTTINIPGALAMCADASCLPLKSHSMDAIVTDLPYGQSVSIMAAGLEALYCAALTEIRRVLKPGRTAVIVTHRDIRELTSTIMTIHEFHEQRVHKSLTRRIMVLSG